MIFLRSRLRKVHLRTTISSLEGLIGFLREALVAVITLEQSREARHLSAAEVDAVKRAQRDTLATLGRKIASCSWQNLPIYVTPPCRQSWIAYGLR